MSETLQIQSINQEQELKPANNALAYINAFSIATHDDAKSLTEDLGKFKARRDAVEAKEKSFTEPIWTVFKRLKAEFKPVIEGYDQAILVGKNKLIAFNQAEQAKAREIERLAREKAAEEARIASDKAKEAEAAARASEQAAQAATTQAEQEAAQIAANQHRETAAQAMNIAHMAASAPPPVSEKIKGARENWKADCFDKLALIGHIAVHPELAGLLMVDETQLHGIARLQKTAFNIPGCRAYDKGSVSIRAAS